MNIIKKTSYTLTAIASLVASQVSADTSKLAGYDLVSIDAPARQIEQAPVHFSQLLTSQSAIDFISKPYKAESNEYWMEVSGKQLQIGIPVHTTSAGSLIRISGKHVKGGLAPASIAIAPEAIELSKGKEKLASPFTQLVTQEQFATANIFPNSSAVQLNKDIGNGTFQLKVAQPLNASDKYIINIKEKASSHLLKASIPKQGYLANESVYFDMSMDSAGEALASHRQQVMLKTPQGNMLPADVAKVDGRYKLTLPTLEANQTAGALFELHLASQANDNGLVVKRNAKLAFAVTQPTARMTGDVNISGLSAMVSVDIASEGRYEVSGVVSGQDSQGQYKHVMLSRSAYYLQPGEQTVELKFDRNLLAKAGVLPPYKVNKMRLVDQSRLGVLQQNLF
ncbi:DUF4785 domain-containing protein [Thalassotalea euphylliae]|uniref:DUF4785 domain-containing protein n=1 Tax=Thalassotalea euphylliae TaxID=1655234 RepID=UPI00364528AB